MKVLCVDDALPIMEDTVAMCRRLPQVTEVTGFTRPREALEWLGTHPADLALLDINMPELNGIALAERIKQRHPRTAIIFLTAFKEYAFDAYSVHPVGYLLKPVSLEQLAAEVDYVCKDVLALRRARVHIKTFGYFDVFVEGKPISFKLAKSKEILAYLVDKQGAGVPRAELFAAIWEDQLYDRGKQKQLDVYIRSLRKTLAEYRVSEIMEIEKGLLRVKPGAFSCDAYLFGEGDRDTINAYRGEYMSAYSWASMTEGLLSRMSEKKN